ncbi:MAG TPA: methyltransferase domain-containing protein [Campylobacterales bacterium]|nr:methyltransferase domain-containing protein [Campylobacterales bacterium]HHS92755.1 methyltransferase domain-containing protein [Campylobacterales bacterium]
MKVVREFSRFAHEYDKYNVIQKEVAKKLCCFLKDKAYKEIIDIGAGDGAIYKNIMARKIQFDSFTALDFSSEMLDLHPKDSAVTKVCSNFNSPKFVLDLESINYDFVISSSALQWSSNLNLTLEMLSKLSKTFYFSFFTSGTFKTLHQTALIDSPIYTRDEIISALEVHFEFEYEVVNYLLDFNSVYEMLRYIKKSGVSSGVKQLSYCQTKSLILNYPLKYLEFEVLFVKAVVKK